ncbi:hypothetical protein ACFQ1M_13910 [Sungkyunkwania multivorans]|uniref:Phenylalanyl-tRNA synthetase subunit alpha n=1 Tax=Sungkyunkwania multivorans TaxID=1173618 RepID=A0ABW3D116_9FLAO
MRKDIEIPEVKDVYVAIVQEYNPEFEWNDWNAYIINDRKDPIEMVLIVSSGFNDDKITSTMRHSIKMMPAKSYAKIELMQEEVLKLTNEFRVSFFADKKMYDKKYVFEKNTISPETIGPLPIIEFKGALGK